MPNVKRVGDQGIAQGEVLMGDEGTGERESGAGGHS